MKGWLSGQTYEAQSKAISNERLINLISQIVPPPPQSHGRNTLVFYGTPGLLLRYNIGTGPIRGSIFSNGRCFAVSGQQLWELFADFTTMFRGNITNDGLPVCMDSNRFQLIITSQQNTYILDLATNILVNVNIPLMQARFADGYFIGKTPDSQIIRISGQYDGIIWDPLDFASAEGKPDNIISVVADHREIWTFGEESVEIWTDSGAQAFPFERIPGALIEQGCAAQESTLQADNSIFWLGADSRGQGVFWRASQYTPTRVSTHAIEYQLSKMPLLSDCIGYAYQEQGHTFCVWTFPTGDKTFVYDCSTTFWHEKAAWVPATGWHRHQVQNHCYAFGRHLVGDKENGYVYEQSLNYFDDNGIPKRWLRAVPIAANENKYLFPKDLELDLEVGTFVPPPAPALPVPM
jgi:hypothetical protein